MSASPKSSSTNTQAHDALVYVWSRPLGADDGCRRLTVARATSARTQWAPAQTLPQLLRTIRASSSSSSSPRAVRNLELHVLDDANRDDDHEDAAWRSICVALGDALRGLRSVHLAAGCSDAHCRALLRQTKCATVRLHSPSTYTTLWPALVENTRLKELWIANGPAISNADVDFLLRHILPRLERFHLDHTPFESIDTWWRVFTWAEDHSMTAVHITPAAATVSTSTTTRSTCPSLLLQDYLDWKYGLHSLRLELLARLAFRRRHLPRARGCVLNHPNKDGGSSYGATNDDARTTIDAGITVLNEWYRSHHLRTAPLVLRTVVETHPPGDHRDGTFPDKAPAVEFGKTDTRPQPPPAASPI